MNTKRWNDAAKTIAHAAHVAHVTCYLTSDNHLLVRTPTGQIVVSTKRGNWRNEKDALRDARAIGLDV